MELLLKPWPWYVSGPLIGLMVPLLLLIGNKPFGVSSSLQHICAACIPIRPKYFRYDWRSESWLLAFIVGIVAGGVLIHFISPSPQLGEISASTQSTLAEWGITEFEGYLPEMLFHSSSMSLTSWLLVIIGGLLVGFGTRYAGGCTSGHAITGLANLQWASLVATIGFFIGGLIMTHLLLPLIF